MFFSANVKDVWSEHSIIYTKSNVPDVFLRSQSLYNSSVNESVKRDDLKLRTSAVRTL